MKKENQTDTSKTPKHAKLKRPKDTAAKPRATSLTDGEPSQLMALANVQSAVASLTSVIKRLGSLTRSPSDLPKELSDYRKRVTMAVLGTKLPSSEQTDIAVSYFASSNFLPGYCTLDAPHVQQIIEVSDTIRRYTADPARKRPLNILMLASPGAGKSHFIKCLADGLRDTSIAPVTYNMTAMERGDDLVRPLDECRNLKVEDKLPLLFLDEFDSDAHNYAKLLPLLWDAEIHLGHRDLKLGKMVIVLAGSSADLPNVMEAAQSMQVTVASSNFAAYENTKIIDLLSRINGGTLQIPDLDAVDESRDRRVDKICIALGLLSARFGKQLSSAPRSLLRFIALTRFKYGVRSIAHLIDLIRTPKKTAKSLARSQLGLPLNSVAALRRSSLAYHLIDPEQAHGVVARWQECSTPDAAITFSIETLVNKRAAERRTAEPKQARSAMRIRKNSSASKRR